ncbi:protein of unknown function [Aliiroseovarius halocynthiae]|uniref:DUF1127 domain-containing protein n=1 Tax=Aliiroseovarius halocynthiae TaxID=985055 RepID=A0A545SRD8_9RHOB|nr:DUF1127 domain-containing protein [Aliiroseovarius halocynthiae]TQV67517.1 DUF1127 domain-containing protein [Aliiroseovarius halocynthiae]SMR81529.1 protein of unknown function [Aliiroseovarius halocynthiae]
MATQTTTIQAPAFSLGSALRTFFAAFGRAMIAAGENSSRMRQVDALRSMSDDELAKLGLKRDDIVRHVFKDLMYV